jgi:hypothetical protein
VGPSTNGSSGTKHRRRPGVKASCNAKPWTQPKSSACGDGQRGVMRCGVNLTSSRCSHSKCLWNWDRPFRSPEARRATPHAPTRSSQLGRHKLWHLRFRAGVFKFGFSNQYMFGLVQQRSRSRDTHTHTPASPPRNTSPASCDHAGCRARPPRVPLHLRGAQHALSIQRHG